MNDRCTSRSVWEKVSFFWLLQPKPTDQLRRHRTLFQRLITCRWEIPGTGSRRKSSCQHPIHLYGCEIDLPTVFAPAEVSRIYLNFSDPLRPKARHARRRLTSNEFFKLYDKVLTADGTVEFKTDNRPLFDFSVEELKTSELFVLDQLSYDLHNDSKMNQGNIMTEYEAKFSSMGNPICKLIAKRR